eukprot:746085-Hanusia_phi.AAC.1
MDEDVRKSADDLWPFSLGTRCKSYRRSHGISKHVKPFFRACSAVSPVDPGQQDVIKSLREFSNPSPTIRFRKHPTLTAHVYPHLARECMVLFVKQSPAPSSEG